MPAIVGKGLTVGFCAVEVKLLEPVQENVLPAELFTVKLMGVPIQTLLTVDAVAVGKALTNTLIVVVAVH